MKFPEPVIILLSQAYISCWSWHLVILFSSLNCSMNLCMANMVLARALLFSFMSLAQSMTSLYRIWYESMKSVILLQKTALVEIMPPGTLPCIDWTLLSPFTNLTFSSFLMIFKNSFASCSVNQSTKNVEPFNSSHLMIPCINRLRNFALLLMDFSFSFFFFIGRAGIMIYG